MTDRKEINRKESGHLAFLSVLFIAGGILLNIGGAQLASFLKLPIYFDSLGTILISAIGGFLPGVIVGFFSNLINGLSNPTNAYYAVLNELIALIVAYYASRGYFHSFPKAMLLVFPLSLVGGALGSILTYFINGFGIGDGISSSLAMTIMSEGRFGVFLSQLSSDMLYDIADKAIIIFIAYFILKLLPENTKKKMQVQGWRQTPLGEEEQKLAQKSTNSPVSLRSKILMMIGIATLFIATVTTGICFTLYRRATVQEHTQMGQGAARLVETVIDGDRVNEYMELGEAAEGYQDVERQLEQIRSSSDEILYVYVYKILEDGCHVVFDLDTEDLQGNPPGDVIEFDEGFEPYLDDLLAGKPIEPVVTDEKFGWLLTMYEPIKDRAGVTQAYACVDISMVQVTLNEISFLTKVAALFFGFFIMIVSIGLWMAEYNLILPINTMAIAANQFACQTEASREESVEHFRDLGIHTGDEIENLYESFEMTIEETVRYIADIQEQSLVINKMQNGLILVLADMVESRDKCTGDHVRKTAAYCRIILEELRKEGLFTDQLTDAYINDVVNSAPLHDIGKIKVSDAILNKPGKLTDEEFEEMKKHTLAGNEIIQQAMELVSSDTGYLKEAKNLATYHHEKWNGTGYPMGLKGDEIPLSARVMAVADVFDALVSQRSYKKPFTFEKAIEIIEEGSGSHFDPQVAGAFLKVKEQARVIAETFMGDAGGLGQTALMPKIREAEPA
ncbi:MAG: HD domain-containing protein [Solobacterium sp.]|nr:HD domain-containing protein [Solobacterium sp.]